MKARDLLRAAQLYANSRHITTNEMLSQLSNEQLTTAVRIAAELLKQLKSEAIRRGIWDDLKTMKVK